MKLPETVRIGQKVYTVGEKRYVFDKNLGGSINYNVDTISIRKGMPEREVEATFFHEIAHGVLHELEFTHPQITSFRSNETFVQEMGLMMRQIFQQLVHEQGVRK